MEKAKVELWFGISQYWQDIFWPFRKKKCTFIKQTDVGFRLVMNCLQKFGFVGGYTWTSKCYDQRLYKTLYEEDNSKETKYNTSPRLIIR